MIGPRKVIAGAQAVKANNAVSVRTLLLWAGLIGAVMLVGWMVYSLMKDLKKAEGVRGRGQSKVPEWGWKALRKRAGPTPLWHFTLTPFLL